MSSRAGIKRKLRPGGTPKIGGWFLLLLLPTYHGNHSCEFVEKKLSSIEQGITSNLIITKRKFWSFIKITTFRHFSLHSFVIGFGCDFMGKQGMAYRQLYNYGTFSDSILISAKKLLLLLSNPINKTNPSLLQNTKAEVFSNFKHWLECISFWE